MSALLAVGCFVAAIVPRRRQGRQGRQRRLWRLGRRGQRGRRSGAVGAPGYFEHIPAEDGAERLSSAFEASGRDPGRALPASPIGTSTIIRSTCRWIEAATTLLLFAPVQVGAVLRPV
ncbi:hypothetical protein ACFV4P_03925 [Kitasatospora sp. NPDC059795]|uniref:hypothetical protein n=1 Tax=Kitasatospora sp. NPDC059795 TaxID=3346949 RepID=UPI0036490FCF